jgi:DDE superfamily endonuclease
MLLLPSDILALLTHFAPLFSRRTWRHVPILLVGALLAPGRRMVSSALRAVGLAHLPTFQTYHRVLNRAVWSSLGASHILLRLLVATFAPVGPLVLGIDETIERRYSQKIAATGIYRDPVRSSHSHFVKVNGLRWICLMLLVPIPWAARVWALPFLTALAPSERSAQEHGRCHKSITTWARQLIRLVHRWLPDRRLVVVGDRGYASLELLAALRPDAAFITRLRLDAHLCAPPPERAPRQIGRPRLVGKRLPTLAHWRDDPTTTWTTLTVPRWYSQRERLVEVVSQTAVWYHTGLPPVPIRWVLIRDPQSKFATQALLCTDPDATPLQILSWFVLRWQTVADGSHLSCGPCSPRRRNPAPVVGAGDCSHDAHVARLVLARHTPGTCADDGELRSNGPNCLVSEGHADLQRRTGTRSPAPVDADDFSCIALPI